MGIGRAGVGVGGGGRGGGVRGRIFLDAVDALDDAAHALEGQSRGDVVYDQEAFAVADVRQTGIGGRRSGRDERRTGSIGPSERCTLLLGSAGGGSTGRMRTLASRI